MQTRREFLCSVSALTLLPLPHQTESEFLEWLMSLQELSSEPRPYISWQKEMHLLECLSPPFSAQFVHHVYPDHFQDVLYLMNDREHGVVGVQFWCLGGMLEATDILSTQDAEETLSPLELYKRGIEWYEATPGWTMLPDEKKTKIREHNEKALRFLANYPERIPRSIWEQALPPKNLIV